MKSSPKKPKTGREKFAQPASRRRELQKLLRLVLAGEISIKSLETARSPMALYRRVNE